MAVCRLPRPKLIRRTTPLGAFPGIFQNHTLIQKRLANLVRPGIIPGQLGLLAGDDKHFYVPGRDHIIRHTTLQPGLWILLKNAQKIPRSQDPRLQDRLFTRRGLV